MGGLEGGFDSYREPQVTLSSEQQEVLSRDKDRKEFEEIFGRDGWRDITDIVEDANIPEKWFINEIRNNREFREEVRDNLELGTETLVSVIGEKYKEVAVSQKEVAVSQKEVAVSQKEVAVSQKEVAVSQKEVAVSQKEVAVSQETAVRATNMETITGNDQAEKRNLDINTEEATKAFYNLVGGKDKLDQYLGTGSLDKWKEQAKKERPDLKPDELEGYVLKAHKEDIIRALPRGEFSSEKLDAIAKSLDAIQIPGISKPEDAFRGTNIPKRHREAMEYGIVSPNGEKNPMVTIDSRGHTLRLAEGNEVYQSYKYDEIPPVKFFEKNGLTIILPRDKISYEPRYNVEAREQSLNEERQLLEADIGKNGDKIDKTREQTIPALQEQLKNLDKGIFTPDMVDTLKEAHNVTLPGVGPDLAQELANSPAIAADKEFLKLHIQGLIESVEAFDSKQARRGEVLNELKDVTIEKRDRVQNYQKRVESSDKVARDNLSTLVGYGFHNFGQGGLESILNMINTNPSLYKSLGLVHQIELNQPFSDTHNPDRRALAEVISRLSGIPAKDLFEADGTTMKSLTPDGKIIDESYIRSAFERSGAISEGVVNEIKIGELLKTGVEKK